MGDFKMGNNTVLTQSGTAKPTFGSGAPTGTVLRVFSQTYTATSQIDESDFETVGGTSTGNLTVTTATPLSSSSKFLLMAHITHSISNSGVITFRFYDGTTAISSSLSDASGNRIQGSFGPGHWSTGPSQYPTNVSSMNHLYAPSSSVALTLSVKGKASGMDTNRNHYYNRSEASNDVTWLSNSISSFTVMEIAG